MIAWNSLQNKEQLEEALEKSNEDTVYIFKHSTRCSISSMALNRLERSWNTDEIKAENMYYLDLISHKEISNQIATQLGVPHQSPQIIALKDGKVIYDASHMEISYKELLKLK